MNGQHLALLATGGTIAGLSVDEQGGYQAARLSIAHLLRGLPEPSLPVRARQIMSLDSRDITPSLMLELAEQTEQCLQDPQVRGVVITHGTDTLEETAFFLSQVLSADKPVVLTAAMRPADSLSGDGPMNLWHALLLAQEPLARGVLVALNDVIYAGREIAKTQASQLAAFTSPWGILGQVEQNAVHFYRQPLSLPPRFRLAKLAKLSAWPETALLYGYAGMPARLLRAVLDSGIQGLVYAAPGNGSVAEELRPVFERADGISVVLASRTGGGWVDAHDQRFLSAGWLNPLQARIMLQLGLASGLSGSALRQLFA